MSNFRFKKKRIYHINKYNSKKMYNKPMRIFFGQKRKNINIKFFIYKIYIYYKAILNYKLHFFNKKRKKCDQETKFLEKIYKSI